MKKTFLLIIGLLFVVSMCGEAQAAAEDVQIAAKKNSKGEGVYKWWRNERTRRQAELDAYVADNRDEFDSFRTAPLGIKQKSKVRSGDGARWRRISPGVASPASRAVVPESVTPLRMADVKRFTGPTH